MIFFIKNGNVIAPLPWHQALLIQHPLASCNDNRDATVIVIMECTIVAMVIVNSFVTTAMENPSVSMKMANTIIHMVTQNIIAVMVMENTDVAMAMENNILSMVMGKSIVVSVIENIIVAVVMED